MTIVGVAMISMPELPALDALRIAAAAAYRIPLEAVAVGEYFGDGDSFPPGHHVYLNLWHSDYDGDLPVAFDQKVDASLVAGVDAAMQRLAEHLGFLIVTDDAEGDLATIHLPNGTVQRRDLVALPDDGIVLPTDLKAFVAAHPKAA
ncbi:MAG: hypothetical protein QM753_07025 [Thermomicrobiales bacterium]